MHPLTQGFLKKGHDVFLAPRFTAMYHRWLKHGNAGFAGPLTTSHLLGGAP
jgi:hypothetical protein